MVGTSSGSPDSSHTLSTLGLATCAHVRPQVSGHRPGHTGCYSAVLATLLASLPAAGVENQATSGVHAQLDHWPGLTTDQKGSAGWKKSPDHRAGLRSKPTGWWSLVRV